MSRLGRGMPLQPIVLRAPDSTPPTVPTGLHTTSVTQTVISVAWGASTDDYTLAGYGVYLDGVKQGADQAGLTASFTGLTPGTAYTVGVDAVDTAGNRSALATLGVTTLPLDSTPPSVPSGLTVTGLGPYGATLSWTASTDNIGVVGYGVYLDGVKQGADQAGLSKVFTLAPSTAYTLGVDAVDAAGNRSALATTSVTTPADVPPTAPTNLHTTSVARTTVGIAWDPATDDVAVTGYSVYLDGVHKADLAGLSYTLTGLTAGTSYTVTVYAKDQLSQSSPAGTLGITTSADAPPSVPGTLQASGVTRTGFTAEWDAATDDWAVAGYRVRLDGVQVAASQPGLSYVFSGLDEDTEYLVEVAAVDDAGQLSAFASLTVETLPDLPPAAPPNLHATTVTYTSIAVAWDPAADDVGVAGYDVWLDGVLVATSQAGMTRSFTGLVEGTAHEVWVYAVDTAGQRSATAAELSVSTLDDTPPTAPTLAVEPGEGSLTLSWGVSSDDIGVTGYRLLLDGVVVHEPPLNGVELTIDGPKLRTHMVTGLAAGWPYTVAVQAYDAVGQTGTTSLAVQTLPVPYLPLAWPVYRLGAWAGNVRDEFGVDWIVEKAEGWQSSPPVRTALALAEAVDGGISGAGRYGPRTIILEGTAVAPTRAAMLAAKQRLVSTLHPGAVGVLRVEAANRTLRAKVRVSDQKTITDRGAKAFTWRLGLLAPDPRRYVIEPVYGTAVIPALPGSAVATVELEGNYPQVPGRMRLYGPIKDFTITHAETGATLRAAAGTELPADPEYSVGIDLAARTVTSYVPAGVSATPLAGRKLLAHLPGWFQLVPGVNTFTLAGAVSGEAGTPRLVVEAYGAFA